MQKMAQEQITLIRRMNDAARVVKAVQTDIAEVKGDVVEIKQDVSKVKIQLGLLKERLHPSAYITQEQAAEVSNRVKALAELLSGKDPSKNHYQGIFGELYRRFGVSSYKTIRVEQYEAVLAFLEDWRQSTGNA